MCVQEALLLGSLLPFLALPEAEPLLALEAVLLTLLLHAPVMPRRLEDLRGGTFQPPGLVVHPPLCAALLHQLCVFLSLTAFLHPLWEAGFQGLQVPLPGPHLVPSPSLFPRLLFGFPVRRCLFSGFHV